MCITSKQPLAWGSIRKQTIRNMYYVWIIGCKDDSMKQTNANNKTNK